ncbi:hypothetical protein [Algoriphagus resistens]|uniref:hypothetical protein n=1 Tax=Algoriphagus resistens TaxID=1750590 RepID=UPI000716C5EC|nr:hypothetical protein [Algoriphagus resistens]
MIEVFKTSINDPIKADFLIEHLMLEFPVHEVNFDPEDSCRILRIANWSVNLEVDQLIKILSVFGEQAAPLL